ncbi:MAG: hypothetical protein HY716_02940 [Planctomycetes bacterium]|nr:hypothetical protein [Planctomycetota bacterium]
MEPRPGEPVDFKRIVSVCERGARAADADPEHLSTAREMYLDLRDLALLEELASMAWAGAERASGEGAAAAQEFSAACRWADQIRAVPRRSHADPCVIELHRAGNPPAPRFIAPRTPPLLEHADLVAFAKRSFRTPEEWNRDPYFRMRVGLHYLHVGAEGRPYAKEELDQVPGEIRMGRHLKALEGVRPVEEELQAKAKYSRAMALIVQGRSRGEALQLFQELKEKYWETDFLKDREQTGGATRRDLVQRHLDGVSGPPAPPIQAGALASVLRSDAVKELGDNRYEVAYDFTQPRPLLDDWTQESLGWEGSVDRPPYGRDGALHLSGCWILYWKPIVQGDVTQEWEIRVPNSEFRNVGFLVHGHRSVEKGRGYSCWLSFQVVREGQLLPLPGGPPHPIFRLPVAMERLVNAAGEVQIGKDLGNGVTFQEGSRHAVMIERKGRTITVSVDGAALTSVEDDATYDSGKVGLAVWNSGVAVEKVRMTVSVDPTWLARQVRNK